MHDLAAENAALRHGDELCRTALARFQTDASTPAFVMARSAVERIAQLEAALREAQAVLAVGSTPTEIELAREIDALLWWGQVR